ncbi:MAG: OmpH family outer membrane protein [Thermoanaerobaculia bacterium]
MFTKNVRIAVLGMAILMLAAGTAGAQEAPLRIAVIDLDRLVALSKAGQALQQKLEVFQRQVQTEGTALADRARATQKLISDGANSLSHDRLAELQAQYEDEGTEVRRFTEKKQREGAKLRDDGLKEIEGKLQPVLDQIQTSGNYDLILNRALGVVVMASDRVDITDQVLVAFDAAEGGSAAPSG